MPDPRIVCAEYMYTREDGQTLHSDVCPPGHDSRNMGEEYRDFLHGCLDEWLDKSGGSGHFVIGQASSDGWVTLHA